MSFPFDVLAKRAIAAALILQIGLLGEPCVHAEKTQTFDSAQSAVAAGWTAIGSGVENQTAGWIDTNDAGGAAAGEAQYDVSRGPELAYVDTNLRVAIDGNTPFSMIGNLAFIGQAAGTPDLGSPPVLEANYGANLNLVRAAVSAVPEPSALALLVGIGTTAGLLRR